MFDYLSNLPVELIHKILDDVSMVNILTCLCLVNKRLRVVSLAYPRFRLDFNNLIKIKHFDLFCTQLISLSSQIVSLSFSNKNDWTIPAKIDRFFSQFNNMKLHSLTLFHIDHIIWKSIKSHVKSIVSLVSISIDLADLRFYDGDRADKLTSNILKDLLYISSSLKCLCLRGEGQPVNISHYNLREEQISSIEHLKLRNIIVNLGDIYSIAPSLRTLDTMTISYRFGRTIHFHLPNTHLTKLSINGNCFSILFVEKLLYTMTRLIHLTIVGNKMFNDVADGISWERILSKIITFKFLFIFDDSLSSEKPIRLDSFCTPFWLEKKQWYVMYNRCTVTGFSLLYSIPYFMNTYPYFDIKGDIIIESTGPQDLSFSNINYFQVSWRSPINSQLIRRFTHLQHLCVRDSERSFRMMLVDIIPYIDMSTITKFIIHNCYTEINIDTFSQLISRMSRLRIFGASITLIKLLCIYHWPNINILRILDQFKNGIITKYALTLNEIDTLFHSFNHVKQIHFMSDNISNLSTFLNNMPITVSNVMLEHPINVTPTTYIYHEFITREWIEQNTRLHNFVYSCDKHNYVSIWL